MIMRSSQKKYLLNATDCPHIGKIINEKVKEQRVTKKQLAQKLGLQPMAISGYVKNQSLHISIVWKISKHLNYNFFGGLAEKLAIPYLTEAEKKLQTQLQQLEQENKDLRNENTLLKELIKGK